MTQYVQRVASCHRHRLSRPEEHNVAPAQLTAILAPTMVVKRTYYNIDGNHCCLMMVDQVVSNNNGIGEAQEEAAGENSSRDEGDHSEEDGEEEYALQAFADHAIGTLSRAQATSHVQTMSHRAGTSARAGPNGTLQGQVVLKQWFLNNLSNPYPNSLAKLDLAERSGLSDDQVRNYLTNVRKRHWYVRYHVWTSPRYHPARSDEMLCRLPVPIPNRNPMLEGKEPRTHIDVVILQYLVAHPEVREKHLARSPTKGKSSGSRR